MEDKRIIGYGVISKGIGGMGGNPLGVEIARERGNASPITDEINL